MKKPKIFIIQIPIFLMLSFAIIVPCLISFKEKLPQGKEIDPLNGLLIVVPAFVVMKITALLLTNKLIFINPKFKKQTEEWVKNTPGRKGYEESQKQLIKLLCLASPICAGLMLIGMNLK